MQHRKRQLPVELWSEIASLLCIDGGATGRTLALVSHYIRDASAPYRFQSVRLSGPAQIVAFNTTFINTPVASRRISHLFFSDCRSKTGKGRLVTNSPAEREAKDHITNIVNAAREHLLTLTIVISNTSHFPHHPFTAVFPRLIELSLIGGRKQACPLTGLSTLTLTHDCPFPVLEKLRIEPVSNYDTCVLAKMTPQLQQIYMRVSNYVDWCRALDVTFPKEKAMHPCPLYCIPPLSSTDGPCIKESVFAHLKEVWIESRVEGSELEEQLLKLAEDDSRVTVVTKCLSGFEAAERDWMHRIAGGVGCWTSKFDVHAVGDAA